MNLNESGVPCCAIGIIPLTPYVYWDYDLDETELTDRGKTFAALRLRDFAKGLCALRHNHWCIRATKNGLHLVQQVPDWDTAQAALTNLYALTHKVSIMNCRKQRIRISPKWDLHTGAVLSPAPFVVDGCEHKETWYVDITDRTKGKLEFYLTKDKTKEVRQWKPEDLILKGGEKIG